MFKILAGVLTHRNGYLNIRGWRGALWDSEKLELTA